MLGPSHYPRIRSIVDCQAKSQGTFDVILLGERRIDPVVPLKSVVVSITALVVFTMALDDGINLRWRSGQLRRLQKTDLSVNSLAPESPLVMCI